MFNLDAPWGEIKRNMLQAAEKGMTDSCNTVERDAKADAPFNDGMLRELLTHDVAFEGEQLVGRVGSNLFYAPYVHQGTGIYAIEGNGRKEVPWHYKDEKGNWHTTKGAKPRPFIFDAFEKNRARIIELLGGAMRDV